MDDVSADALSDREAGSGYFERLLLMRDWGGAKVFQVGALFVRRNLGGKSDCIHLIISEYNRS